MYTPHQQYRYALSLAILLAASGTWVPAALASTEAGAKATTGGAGMRYEIARKYGVHMGMDVAWSRDGGAVYIPFGSAWIRP